MTKTNILTLAEKLEQLQTDLWRAAEYGAEQLDLAVDLLES